MSIDKLAVALELLKMAKLAAGHRKRRPVVTVAMQDVQSQKGEVDEGELKNGLPPPQLFDAAPREVLRALSAAGIDTMLTPESALVDFVISRAPPPKNLTRRQRREKWMRERE